MQYSFIYEYVRVLPAYRARVRVQQGRTRTEAEPNPNRTRTIDFLTEPNPNSQIWKFNEHEPNPNCEVKNTRTQVQTTYIKKFKIFSTFLKKLLSYHWRASDFQSLFISNFQQVFYKVL